MKYNLDEKYFIDTNIFVYSFDPDNRQKQSTAEKIIENSLGTGKGAISFQVVQEFLSVATRKFSSPMSLNDAQVYLAMVLRPLCKVFSSISLYSRSLDISDRYKYSFYDSLIIASALEANCKYLLTEDLKSGQQLDSLTIVNPFLS